MRQILTIGLRNVARNHRRTWLTAGGIAFAILLVGVSAALQDGSYDLQRRTATDLLTGHVQIVHPDYPEEGDVALLVDEASAIVESIEQVPGVLMAAPRLQVFALVSHGERSVAGQVLGLAFEREARYTTVIRKIVHGRPPAAPDEVLMGAAMARNLAVEPGDEIIVLGSGPTGGVAALGVRLAGVLDTGLVELDRALLVVDYALLAQALETVDQAHSIVVKGDDPEAADALAAAFRDKLPDAVLVRTWRDIMPELEQAIELDRLGGYLYFGVILFLVSFSVANTFVMIVFERTREIGMLRSLGMRPWAIIALLQVEAATLWVIGTIAGLAIALPIIGWMVVEGIYFGETLEATMTQMYMPSRVHAELTLRSIVVAPLILLIATQVAAVLPALRVRRILPALALRHLA